MHFVIDAQLPPALARLISSRGHIAEHVADIDLRHAEDSRIWSYAVEHGAVDEDFPRLVRNRESSPVIVWLRIGNTSRRALLEWFEPLLPQIETLSSQGERLLEVR